MTLLTFTMTLLNSVVTLRTSQITTSAVHVYFVIIFTTTYEVKLRSCKANRPSGVNKVVFSWLAITR